MGIRIGTILALAACLLAGCASSTTGRTMDAFGEIRVTEHRSGDDLLTAGLGIDGLRGPAPALADPLHPTPAELRRRAIWANWRGIADLSPTGGYGQVYGSTKAVPGREYHALATVPGARHPHRVATQVPDNFDANARCLLVAPASGSRGVYGAIAVAGPWGLPKGCAVAYTDRGAGTDYFDFDAGTGTALDGTPRAASAGGLAFDPGVPGQGVAFKHAHSRDNPEKDWGRHVRQAAEFGLLALSRAFPEQPRFDFGNTRVIAVAISNGGGAVLQAASIDGDWLDAVVAGEPNVHVAGAPPLFDLATEAALLMPCAIEHLGIRTPPGVQPACGALADAGVLPGVRAETISRAAYDRLRARGWDDATLRANGTYVAFDLWHSIAAAYASAYGRFEAGEHPCGYRYAAVDEAGRARLTTAVERATWWSDASGIPPGAGVALVSPEGARVENLRCLRGLWDGAGSAADRVRRGIAETRTAPPVEGLPIIVVHGLDDGLIPPAFTSLPYVEAARAAGRDVRYWQVGNAQHFDGFLGLPGFAAKYVPMLPYVYAALDRVEAHLASASPMPESRRIEPVLRGQEAVLRPDHLRIPRD